MLEAISIGISGNMEQVIKRLNNEFKTLNSEGVNLKYKIKNKGDLVFLGCGIEDKKISKQVFQKHFAQVLTNIICEDWPIIIVNKIIKENYYYFSEEEKKDIKKNALVLISDQDRKFYFDQQKQRIRQRILEYLEKNDELVLEGFINFRLKDYVVAIGELVDIVVDDFLIEKEYLEFIRLLRYFVDIQEPKEEEINILLPKENVFYLLDQEGQIIENEYLNGLTVDLMNNSFNYEDLLISALITLAPKKIVIHTKKKDQFADTLKTIEHIFGTRASYCTGCIICQQKI